ncbi:MAG TPA: N-hydroxyarylamine O-acetyltransferase [Franconibacter helveticus]|nr:N-hydroxyarylamine O-acetyltransferase [Franconibacter helveticus]
MAFSLNEYLARIGFNREARADFSAFQSLHRRHIAAIAFENLDVLLNREILLDDDSIFDKLVTAGRGGYCFEHNALFTRALNDIGFETHNLAARVLVAKPDEMPPRTHRLVMVQCEEATWIADVGFGGLTLSVPLPLKDGAEQASAQGLYRLEKKQNEFLLLLRQHDHFQPLYRFDLEKQYPADYLMANHFIAHWPDSHFRHHLLAALPPLDDCRLTLVNRRQTLHLKPPRQEALKDNDALYDSLQQRFNIRLDHPRHGVTRDALSNMMDKLLAQEEAESQ